MKQTCAEPPTIEFGALILNPIGDILSELGSASRSGEPTGRPKYAKYTVVDVTEAKTLAYFHQLYRSLLMCMMVERMRRMAAAAGEPRLAATAQG